MRTDDRDFWSYELSSSVLKVLTLDWGIVLGPQFKVVPGFGGEGNNNMSRPRLNASKSRLIAAKIVNYGHFKNTTNSTTGL